MRYLCVRVINLFPFIIYVIENVIYVSMNFELRPTRRVVNLSPQTCPQYTFLHSLVWCARKSPQTESRGARLLSSLRSLAKRSWMPRIGRDMTGQEEAATAAV